MNNKTQRRLFDTINEIMSSTNSVVNRSTNTSNVSGLGSVSGTDGGGIVYKPIKPTVGTHIPKVPGMKEPVRMGFGWIADKSVVVQMLKNAGIEADDGDDPRALFQSLNRAKTAQQIAVADKMAKLTGTSIDRKTMLSDFQNALDVYDKSAKEWSDHTEEIADRLHAVKQNVLSKIWKDGGTRTDRANDMVSQWSKQKMDQHAGSSPGEPAGVDMPDWWPWWLETPGWDPTDPWSPWHRPPHIVTPDVVTKPWWPGGIVPPWIWPFVPDPPPGYKPPEQPWWWPTPLRWIFPNFGPDDLPELPDLGNPFRWNPTTPDKTPKYIRPQRWPKPNPMGPNQPNEPDP